MDSIKRSDLPAHTSLFGLDYGKAGIDAALRATGLRPVSFEGQPGGRGRIAYYSPLVLWLLVAVWESQKRRFGDLRNAIEYFRGLYDELNSVPDAAYIPGFGNDRESGAQLLMLTSPVYGLEPRDIRRITFAHPETLEYSQHGRRYLVNILQAYNNVFGRTVASLSVDPEDGPMSARDEQVRRFALDVLHEARLLFEIDSFESQRTEGGGA